MPAAAQAVEGRVRRRWGASQSDQRRAPRCPDPSSDTRGARSDRGVLGHGSEGAPRGGRGREALAGDDDDGAGMTERADVHQLSQHVHRVVYVQPERHIFGPLSPPCIHSSGTMAILPTVVPVTDSAKARSTALSVKGERGSGHNGRAKRVCQLSVCQLRNWQSSGCCFLSGGRARPLFCSPTCARQPVMAGGG